MQKQERIRLMDEYINKKSFATMEELCKEFSVSMNTVRSDVRTIVDMGHARKDYGGVTGICSELAVQKLQSGWPVNYGSYESRLMLNAVQKRKIAECAAGLINNEDIVYVDVGSTCLQMIDFIPQNYHVTVISNDLNIINKVAQRRNIRLLTFGGTYHPKSNSFQCSFGDLHAYMNTCNIIKAFLGTTGISSSGQMTCSENFGHEVRVSLLKSCKSCYLLADASKFGKVALYSYGSLTDLAACISDSTLKEEYQELCQRLGVDLRLATCSEEQEST